VLPLPAPVKPLQWRNVTRDAIIERYGIPADPATKDPARIYYLPTSPDGTGTLYVGNGDSSLTDAQKRLYAKKGVLRNVALGLPLATVNRDAAMQSAASSMGFMFPELTDDQIIELATPALKAMPSDNTLEQEQDKFREKLERARVRKEEKDQEQVELLKVFAPDAAPAPAPAPLVPNVDAPTIDPRHWIIQKEAAHFFHVAGDYTGPFSLPCAYNAMRQEFRKRAPFPLSTVSDKGKVHDFTLNEMIERHGTVAHELTGSMLAQKSYFDTRTMTFVEAMAPIRPFSPVEHKDVHAWLVALGGKQSDQLLDWVAGVTKLDVQCCALLIEGDSGAGKGLLAAGLSSLWSDSGPSPFDVITGEWNSLLKTCPLVFADEGLPLPRNGSINDILRKALGSSSFALKRKFLPDSTVKGALRVMMASNNSQMLKGFDDVGPEDRLAIAQRILLVEVHDGVARALLEAMPQADKECWAKMCIAEHALWLRDNRVITPGKRFLVEGRGTDIVDRLSVTAGLASDLVEFMVHNLHAGIVNSHKKSKDIIIEGGKLFVSANLFRNPATWENVTGSPRKPPVQKVVSALRNISDGVEDRQGRKFYRIRIELLDIWHGVAQSDLYQTVRQEVTK
jgi:hypothetical protein